MVLEERQFKAIAFGIPAVILTVAALKELQSGNTALVNKAWTRAWIQGNIPWLMQSVGVFGFLAYQNYITSE